MQGALHCLHACSTRIWPLCSIYRLSKPEGCFSAMAGGLVHEAGRCTGLSAQQHLPKDAEGCCPWLQLCSSVCTDLQRSCCPFIKSSTFHQEGVWKTSGCQPRASPLNWEPKCPGHVAMTGVSPRERSHLSAAPGCRTAVGCWSWQALPGAASSALLMVMLH